MNALIPKYISLIRTYLFAQYKGMFREPGGSLQFPFLTPGSDQYSDVLWDWDSWLTNVALRQIVLENPTDRETIKPYERGCILNFLAHCKRGYVPIVIQRTPYQYPENVFTANMHKPCLAQHAALLIRENGGEIEWLREGFYRLQQYLTFYRSYQKHSCGLYFWQNDIAIGVDNDPSTYGRPPQSSGSIYLNCLMYQELQAAAFLADTLNQSEIGSSYRREAEELKEAIQKHCWDEWTGFYYSVDLNLVHNAQQKGEFTHQVIHSGNPRSWPCLIQRIGVWSGFLSMWAGIAKPEEARRMVEEHYRNDRTFRCLGGVRTLSRLEKMYDVRASGNPSSWLGPVWGISNYMVFRGLVRYGFEEDARELAEKTIMLFGRDLERFGAFHEYYQPENGEPLLNRGFQNWNCLVLNMAAWIEKKPYAEEWLSLD